MIKYLVGATVVVAVGAVGAVLLLTPAPPRSETAFHTIERQANVFSFNREQAPSVDIDDDGNVLYPPMARQLGSANLVFTGSDGIKHGVYRNGSLWMAHTIGEAGVARVRWYEFAMNGWPTSGQNPALVQSGTINRGSGVSTWFADLDVDTHGNMAIAYNRSSSTEYVGIERAYRLAGDPPGTLQSFSLQQASTSPELSNRWGDYGGIHQDPTEPARFWNTHEYRTTGWRTWVAAFHIPVACPEDVDGSGAVDFGDILFVLARWGQAGGPADIDGSGTVAFGDLLAILAGWGPCG